VNLTFDAWYAAPTLCRECCEPVPSADVDIDDEGRTVATCDACRADEPTDPIVRKARRSSARMLRIYVGVARGTLPDNGESAATKWGNVARAAERFLTWKESR
jgi:hypothetical protein